MLPLGDQHRNPVKPKITENSKYGDKRDGSEQLLDKTPGMEVDQKKKVASES